MQMDSDLEVSQRPSKPSGGRLRFADTNSLVCSLESHSSFGADGSLRQQAGSPFFPDCMSALKLLDITNTHQYRNKGEGVAPSVCKLNVLSHDSLQQQENVVTTSALKIHTAFNQTASCGASTENEDLSSVIEHSPSTATFVTATSSKAMDSASAPSSSPTCHLKIDPAATLDDLDELLATVFNAIRVHVKDEANSSSGADSETEFESSWKEYLLDSKKKYTIAMARINKELSLASGSEPETRRKLASPPARLPSEKKFATLAFGSKIPRVLSNVSLKRSAEEAHQDRQSAVESRQTSYSTKSSASSTARGIFRALRCRVGDLEDRGLETASQLKASTTAPLLSKSSRRCASLDIDARYPTWLGLPSIERSMCSGRSALRPYMLRRRTTQPSLVTIKCSNYLVEDF